MNKPLLYKIAKLTAEADSIAEGYLYYETNGYTKKNFEEDLKEMEDAFKHPYDNHAKQAIRILELIKKEVKNKGLWRLPL